MTGGQPHFRRWAEEGGGWFGTGAMPEWAGEILDRDPDVYITDSPRRVTVLHRHGGTVDEYRDRISAASPPITGDQKHTIREAFRAYWVQKDSHD